MPSDIEDLHLVANHFILSCEPLCPTPKKPTDPHHVEKAKPDSLVSNTTHSESQSKQDQRQMAASGVHPGLKTSLTLFQEAEEDAP